MNKTQQGNQDQAKKKLTDILTKIFRLNSGDLDFGIYKILNYKKNEIQQFINDDLIQEITVQLKLMSAEEQETLQAELRDTKQQLIDLGIQDYERSQKYLQVKKRLDERTVSREREILIYNNICTFFSRYYDDGDFFSKRRYGTNARYVVPYGGEEVMLYWANNDQYYIKTTESFNKFSFGASGITVNFMVVEVEEEKGNAESNKNKFFFIAPGNVCEWRGKELNFFFEYRAPTGIGKKTNKRLTQDKINKETLHRIQEALKKSKETGMLFKEESGDTLLGRNLRKYTRKNTSDYFIHKDLGGFLRRELDAYIKNEVINLDDVFKSNLEIIGKRVLECRVLRNICHKIIEFLAQIENFQKKLWEKKKFVLQTDYCITLDYIDEKHYHEILTNKEQLKAWKDLYGFDMKDEIKNLKCTLDEYKQESNQIEVLKSNPTLMLDTKFFDYDFKLKLLAEIEISDDKINGVMINSENSQALNLLAAKYERKIDIVHIDPPYNTQTSGFLYKNNYMHSSWLSMMNDRVKLVSSMISNKGSFLCHIDDIEYEKLELMLNDFPIPNAGTITWDKRNPVSGKKGVSMQHEYIIFRSNHNTPLYRRSENRISMLAKAKSIIRKHGGTTNKAQEEYTSWVNKTTKLSGGEKQYRYLDDTGIYRHASMAWPNKKRAPDEYFIPLIHPITGKPCPVPANGFRYIPEALDKMNKNGKIIFGKDETTQPLRKRSLTETEQVSSVISDGKKGSDDISILGLDFPYCHPVSLYVKLLDSAILSKDDLIIDFFAGSGTTGHAILSLNKKYNENHKFILVETGLYFEPVTKSRIQKIIYSENWKNGKPENNSGTKKQIIKYQRLEQYEDALENITFSQKPLHEFSDYFVKYMLDFETRESNTLLNIDGMVRIHSTTS